MSLPVARAITASPRGMTALGIFLLFGAAMAFLAGATLAWPGSVLDRMWKLNPRAYSELAPHGKAVGILFLVLGATLAIACVCWFKRNLLGWRLAALVMAIQVLSDVVNGFRGQVVAGGIGALISGALLFYLLRPEVRAAFAGDARTLRRAESRSE